MGELHFPGLNLHYFGPKDIIAVLSLVIVIVAVIVFVKSGRDCDDDR